jgi:DNA-binding NarL/FixJ family response regulator
VTVTTEVTELTSVEADLMAHIAQGHDFPQIAREMGITVYAARLINRDLFERLGARNAAHAVGIVVGLGLIPADVATSPTTQTGGHDVR